MALKKHYPDITFSGNYVDPDECDRYEVYHIFGPSGAYNFCGTFAGGTAGQAKALVLETAAILDYPRTLRVSVVGTADCGGTATINGIDQFGATISETIGFGTQAAGTPTTGDNGTKVFAQLTSGTFTYATAQSGAGSAQLGVSVTGTETMFGLPLKIGATTDVVLMTQGTNSVPVVVGEGTVASFVDIGMHAVKAAKNITGTADWVHVWLKPSYNTGTTDGKKMANLSQKV